MSMEKNVEYSARAQSEGSPSDLGGLEGQSAVGNVDREMGHKDDNVEETTRQNRYNDDSIAENVGDTLHMIMGDRGAEEMRDYASDSHDTVNQEAEHDLLQRTLQESIQNSIADSLAGNVGSSSNEAAHGTQDINDTVFLNALSEINSAILNHSKESNEQAVKRDDGYEQERNDDEENTNVEQVKPVVVEESLQENAEENQFNVNENKQEIDQQFIERDGVDPESETLADQEMDKELQFGGDKLIRQEEMDKELQFGGDKLIVQENDQKKQAQDVNKDELNSNNQTKDNLMEQQSQNEIMSDQPVIEDQTTSDQPSTNNQTISDQPSTDNQTTSDQPIIVSDTHVDDINDKQRQPSMETEPKTEFVSPLLLTQQTGYSIFEKIRKVSALPYVTASQAQLAALPLIITAPDYLPLEVQLSINSLPILDNLATQLLRIFVSASYEEILSLTQVPEPEGDEEVELSANAESFQALVRLFSIAKSIYTRNEKDFISVEDVAPGIWKAGEPAPSILTGKEEIFENSLKKANLATFICGVINSIEMEFISLNENFLEVFCPNDTINFQGPSMESPDSVVDTITGYGLSGRLLKPQAGLFLELKTQAYISALISHNSKEVAKADLQHLFPDNLDTMFLQRRKSQRLSSTEADFVARCLSRKKVLDQCSSPEELTERYSFDVFVRTLLDYLNTNLGFLVYGKRYRSKTRNTLWANGLSSSVASNSTSPVPQTSSSLPSMIARLRTDFKAPSFFENTDKSSSSPAPPASKRKSPEPEPKSVEKPAKKPKKPSEKPIVRRAWSKEEEDALRKGLMMKGAHWVQILELFGPGGKINECLKDRNQVQLKDKARNWKMYYLRDNLEVPDYLKGVTGDLGGSNGRTIGKRRAKLLQQAKIKSSLSPPPPSSNSLDNNLAVSNSTGLSNSNSIQSDSSSTGVKQAHTSNQQPAVDPVIISTSNMNKQNQSSVSAETKQSTGSEKEQAVNTLQRTEKEGVE